MPWHRFHKHHGTKRCDLELGKDGDKARQILLYSELQIRGVLRIIER